MLIEVLLLGGDVETDGRPQFLARQVGNTEQAERTKHVWAKKGGRLRNARAHVVSDDEGAVLAQRLDQTNNVRDEVEDVVCRDLVGRIGLAVTTLVGCDYPKSGCGERRYLVAPAVPGFRPSMAKENHGAFALFHII